MRRRARGTRRRTGAGSINAPAGLFKGFPPAHFQRMQSPMSEPLPDLPYTLHAPRRIATPLVFASPHSGRLYTPEFCARTALTARQLRSSEDAFVDRLFAAAPHHGAPLLAASLPRAWLDLNRAPDELDPALIDGARRGVQSPRVASGLGVVPRVVSNGRTIYRGKITPAEAEARIRGVWHPYHARLARLMDDARARFGQAILLDCHSMPHEALEMAAMGGRRPDLVLGDRYGAAAHPRIVDLVEAEFRAAGFTVSRNAPFAGAYITQHYGRPERGSHAIQVEIDRALYMDEATIAPHAGFDEIKARIDGVVAAICAYGRSGETPLAAE